MQLNKLFQVALADLSPTYLFLALALTAGRITVVTSREGDTAFLSANDRSRWATVACLVERGTYVIDEQIAIANPIHRNRRPWNSIDKVRHLGADGSQHYYSSKPPLLATMVAGVYWLVHQITGMTLTQYPAYVPRLILLLFNLPLLAIFFTPPLQPHTDSSSPIGAGNLLQQARALEQWFCRYNLAEQSPPRLHFHCRRDVDLYARS